MSVAQAGAEDGIAIGWNMRSWTSIGADAEEYTLTESIEFVRRNEPWRRTDGVLRTSWARKAAGGGDDRACSDERPRVGDSGEVSSISAGVYALGGFLTLDLRTGGGVYDCDSCGDDGECGGAVCRDIIICMYVGG